MWDHTEHDVDVIAEHGLADLRGLAPRERALLIIRNCVDPCTKVHCRTISTRLCRRGGHTPHLLEQTFAWHTRYQETGAML